MDKSEIVKGNPERLAKYRKNATEANDTKGFDDSIDLGGM